MSKFVPPPICYMPADARRVLGMSKDRFAELDAGGELKIIKDGRRRLVCVDSVLAVYDRMAAARKTGGRNDARSGFAA